MLWFLLGSGVVIFVIRLFALNYIEVINALPVAYLLIVNPPAAIAAAVVLYVCMGSRRSVKVFLLVLVLMLVLGPLIPDPPQVPVAPGTSTAEDARHG